MGKQVLIIGGHPIVTEAMSMLLSKIDPVLNITICHCPQVAIATFRNSAWFRIFVDIDVPGVDGLSLLRKFTEFGVANISTVIAASNNQQWRADVSAMGFPGYIIKAMHVEDFSLALKVALQEQPLFPGMQASQPTPARLTRRQKDVLWLIHRGFTSKQIASQLNLATGTVDNHVSGLLSALGVSGRTHAIVRAIELGYINPKDSSHRQSNRDN